MDVGYLENMLRLNLQIDLQQCLCAYLQEL